MPQSRYFPLKLWTINFSPSLISCLIESVMWISPPIPFLCFFSLLNIFLCNIYLPIIAKLEGAWLIFGFSITSFIIEFLVLTSSSLSFLHLNHCFTILILIFLIWTLIIFDLDFSEVIFVDIKFNLTILLRLSLHWASWTMFLYWACF